MEDYIIGDQLAGLLCLEIKYSTRDYLLDAATMPETDRSGHCTASSKSRLITVSMTTATATRDDHKIYIEEDKEYIMDTSSSSLTADKTLIDKQKAIDWRSVICEWFYQCKLIADEKRQYHIRNDLFI
jgi:hypothetical protein